MAPNLLCCVIPGETGQKRNSHGMWKTKAKHQLSFSEASCEHRVTGTEEPPGSPTVAALHAPVPPHTVAPGSPQVLGSKEAADAQR